MLLPMNHQFYPYQRYVIPIVQRGKGDISIYGGTDLYGQGGNGLGGIFCSLFVLFRDALHSCHRTIRPTSLQCLYQDLA